MMIINNVEVRIDFFADIFVPPSLGPARDGVKIGV
jgi:hypothetical protein